MTATLWNWLHSGRTWTDGLSCTHSHTSCLLQADWACCCLLWVRVVSSLGWKSWSASGEVFGRFAGCGRASLPDCCSDSPGWGLKNTLRLILVAMIPTLRPLLLRMSAKMSKLQPLEDISQTFCLFSCCRQRCWCHLSCRFLSVSIRRSLCSPSVAPNHKQGTVSWLTNPKQHTVLTQVILTNCHPESPPKLLQIYCIRLLGYLIINQSFTDCLSSSSCLRSQSASERTIVSWGSKVEESSPRLGEGRAEERGVRGVTVSSSILRSCCDGRVINT